MNLTEEIIAVLVQFGGGAGREPGSVAVRFLLPTFFWSILACIALKEWRRTDEKRDLFIGIASLTGVGRELLMFAAEYGSLRGYLSFNCIHAYYPPFEHAATMVSGIFIGAASVNYLTGWRRFSRIYFLSAAVCAVLLYALTAVLWPAFLNDHPSAAFGSFWGDFAFRLTSSSFLGLVLGIALHQRARGTRVHPALLFGLVFLFLDEFLMIVNLATQERFVNLYAPVRHNLHIWAIPLFLGFYWSALKDRLRTALNDAEQERAKTEAIIAGIGDGISIQDASFRVLYQNQNHKEFIGEHKDEYCYRAYEQRESTCDGCPVALTFQDGKVHRSERTLAYPQGIRSFEITSSPLRNFEGTIIGGIEVVREITEKKRLEAETIRSQKLESIGLLAGGLAHDFNNLLTSILGNINLAKRYLDLSHKAHSRLEDAEKASLRARDLTRQLLTFSRGGAPVKRTASIIDIIRESIGFTLSGSNVKAEYHVPDRVWDVDVDAGQMSQVFNNLAMNAVQAMPEGGIITIRIANEVVPDNAIPGLPAGGYVAISAADTGTGIPEENLVKIFDPYFTTKPKGNGLGLSTAYSIIKRHDGCIIAESKPGQGALFHIYLRASQLPVKTTAATKDSPAAARGLILVMDDDAMVRNVAGEMLRELGYAVEFAGDGAEAVALYQKHLGANRPFAAVIMDLTIPGGMGGREAIGKLRTIDPRAKVLASSGYSNDPIMSDCARYGFDGAVDKPYTTESLGKALRKAMQRGGPSDRS